MCVCVFLVCPSGHSRERVGTIPLVNKCHCGCPIMGRVGQGETLKLYANGHTIIIGKPPIKSQLSKPPLNTQLSKPPLNTQLSKPPLKSQLSKPPLNTQLSKPPLNTQQAYPQISTKQASPHYSLCPLVHIGTTPLVNSIDSTNALCGCHYGEGGTGVNTKVQIH